MDNTITKEEEKTVNFYLTIKIPVNIKVKQDYLLYRDEFENPYYEKDYDSYDELSEAKYQNKKILDMMHYVKSKGWDITSEEVE